MMCLEVGRFFFSLTACIHELARARGLDGPDSSAVMRLALATALET